MENLPAKPVELNHQPGEIMQELIISRKENVETNNNLSGHNPGIVQQNNEVFQTASELTDAVAKVVHHIPRLEIFTAK